MGDGGEWWLGCEGEVVGVAVVDGERGGGVVGGLSVEIVVVIEAGVGLE